LIPAKSWRIVRVYSKQTWELDMYAVSYMSCFGTPEVVIDLTRRNAYALVEYLKKHPVAYPLCIIHVTGEKT